MVGDHFARMNAVLWQCYSLFILVLFPEKEAKSQGEKDQYQTEDEVGVHNIFLLINYLPKQRCRSGFQPRRMWIISHYGGGCKLLLQGSCLEIYSLIYKQWPLPSGEPAGAEPPDRH